MLFLAVIKKYNILELFFAILAMAQDFLIEVHPEFVDAVQVLGITKLDKLLPIAPRPNL